MLILELPKIPGVHNDTGVRAIFFKHDEFNNAVFYWTKGCLVVGVKTSWLPRANKTYELPRATTTWTRRTRLWTFCSSKWMYSCSPTVVNTKEKISSDIKGLKILQRASILSICWQNKEKFMAEVCRATDFHVTMLTASRRFSDNILRLVSRLLFPEQNTLCHLLRKWDVLTKTLK